MKEVGKVTMSRQRSLKADRGTSGEAEYELIGKSGNDGIENIQVKHSTRAKSAKVLDFNVILKCRVGLKRN